MPFSSREYHKASRRESCLRPVDYEEEWDSRFIFRGENPDFVDKYDIWGQKGWFKPSCVPITIILILIVLVVILPLMDAADKRSLNSHKPHQHCLQPCRFTLVESIPQGLVYDNWTQAHPSTYSVWRELISSANSSIEIASFYWTLRSADFINYPVPGYPGSKEGEQIFKDLLEAGTTRGIEIKIVQNEPSKTQPNLDTELLTRKKAAKVVSLNMPRLVGSGILHTKLWLVDRQKAYLGSANMDWRSLTQVKELGILVENCSCIVDDIGKLFDIYWKVSGPNGHIPEKWPQSLDTEINVSSPVDVLLDNGLFPVYLSSSPPELCSEGRTGDIDAILNTISTAEKFVYISVMDYLPLLIYSPRPKFWPVIDDALRSVAIDHRIEVRLLISQWDHSRPAEIIFLKSLRDISGSYKNVNVKVKLFKVPASEEQKSIPFARVNHNKYMVTDNKAYIGTSNWSGDYFTTTAGVGFIVGGNSTLRQQLEDVFLRDWNSNYSSPLPL